MRKTTFALGLGLALSLGAASVEAQAPQARGGAKAGEQRGPGGAGEGRFQRGDRGPGALLRGITLTEAQKAQVKTLRQRQQEARTASRDDGRKDFEALREARQTGDTATLRKLQAERQAAMAKAREQETAALRAILTVEQRVTFDKNVATLKAQQEKRQAQAKDGRGRGGRGGQRGGRVG